MREGAVGAALYELSVFLNHFGVAGAIQVI